MLLVHNVFADSGNDFYYLEDSIVVEYWDGYATDEYSSAIWEKYDKSSDTYTYKDCYGNIIEKHGAEYRNEYFSPKYTIDGQLLHLEEVHNYIDESFTEIIEVYCTDNGEQAIFFYEYGINGDLEIKYRTESVPQPTYNLYVNNELFFTGISGEEINLPLGNTHNRENEQGDIIVYETVKWLSDDLEHEYVPGEIFKIPNRDVYLSPVYDSKTDIASHLILFDLNGGLGKVDEIYDYEWCNVKLPAYDYAHKTDSTLIFSHWTDGTANYNPGDTFIMPDHDVTMTAVWTENEPPVDDNPEVDNPPLEDEEDPPVCPPAMNFPFNFKDIFTHWAEKIIKFITEHGFMGGITDTEFCPNSPMTREMFITALARLADVKEDAISWAISNGLLTGYGNGNYGLKDTITREQMTVLITRYCDIMDIDLNSYKSVGGNFTFADDKYISSWAAPSVYKIYSVGLIRGKGNNLYDPRGMTTRAEAASVLYNLIQTIKD